MDQERDIKGGHDSASSMQSRVRLLEEELEEEREANQKRVADTPQFQQMKKMMANQNKKMKDLR